MQWFLKVKTLGVTFMDMPIYKKLTYIYKSEMTSFHMPGHKYGRIYEKLGYDKYMNKLYKAYNPATLPGLMCRNMISVGPDGSLYDCDFNYIEKLKISGEVNHVSQLVDNHTGVRRIVTGMHCYGCTAGAGSS